ncbi:hypothetical protein C8A05DRAFT_34361 [Staphylotrichum tortipilum]|uniref:Uncharacterized protein n=1 Tax=Staphylotrichum tortipilum TaxID=2831512 RepID=A0AAN6MKY3_9PEZI|nr:hypothetical protein C8A05DRAFT_34361 [Staphylotrichum longicolle]
MGGTEPPFMYQAVKKDDGRFPAASFDPKAVTRASWEPKKQKPKPDGPLVSFNRHPDALMVPTGRSRYKPMGRRTKSWIKAMRVVQLGLRVVEAIAAVGLIAVMSVSGFIGWITGATLGVVIVFCLYSVFHHARPAGSRAPGSSAAYQIFSGISDLCVLPLYAYGALTTRNKSENLSVNGDPNPNETKYMVPAMYYGLIGAGGLHLLSLAISLWLALMFRRIANMPPDMNPLESNLTSRAHTRNKSSVATTATGSTASYSDKGSRDSQLYDDAASSRPPSVPFMHTRQGSASSLTSHDSRLNLPSRQYQIAPGNRSSATSQDLKRMSAPPSSQDLNLKRMSAPPPSSKRASYMEVPLGETGDLASPTASSSRPVSLYSSRPSSGTVPSYRAEPVSPAQTVQPRSAKFTETWYTSESLISRTQQRNRLTKPPPATTPQHQQQRQQQQSQRTPPATAYASLDASSDSDSDSDTNDNENFYTPAPTTPAPAPRRPRTPFSRLRNSILSDIPLNHRRVSGGGLGQDITDQTLKIGNDFQPRDRNSSIQPESAFYSKPYGELKAATPPIMVGGGRVVSSGNDLYDDGDLGRVVGRRGVSGKVAEEGRAGAGWR